MKTASPFEFISDPTSHVTVRFDGVDHLLPDGDNLAAALLFAGVRGIRETPVSRAPRAPFCMMGACFDCLVVIDGVTRQACMIEVREGLVVERTKPAGGRAHGQD